jgi:hypothetical protein
VAAADDGGFVLAVGTNVHRPPYYVDMWVARMNSKGKIIWQKTIGRDDAVDQPQAIRATPDGGFLIAGGQTWGDFIGDGFVIKLDAAGRMEWKRNFISAYDVAEIRALRCEPDGSFIACGLAGVPDFHGFYYTWVFKMSASGAIVWQRLYGESGDDSGTLAIIKSGDGYLIAQRSIVLKISFSGRLQWAKTYEGAWIEDATAITNGEFALAVSLDFANGFGIMNLNAKGLTGAECSLIKGRILDYSPRLAEIRNQTYIIKRTKVEVQSLNFPSSTVKGEVNIICAPAGVSTPNRSQKAPY